MSRSTQDADSGADDGEEWESASIREATESLRGELESAEADASGARAIALSRAQDLVDKLENTLRKTHR